VTVFALILLLAVAPATQPKAARPTERVGQEGCVRPECHPDVRNYAAVHGPVVSNACDACHELTDAESHTFALARQKQELCTYCHEFDPTLASPVVHKPVAEGQCLGCHDPHGGRTREYLREALIEATCASCHESMTRGRSFLHTPAAQGACTSCHPPHAARFAKLLDMDGPDLCLACHQQFERSLASVKFAHKALKEGCRRCHDPHGSANPMSTTQPVLAQCGGCHADTVARASASKFAHGAVSDTKACVNCHTPHGSSLARLMSATPAKVCAECHAKEVKATRGATITAMPDLAGGAAGHVHGAIKDGSCSGCHAAHGGERAALLTKFYSGLFYQRYSAGAYELCISCHDGKLLTEPRTTTATAFRNGDRNLHALHVVEQGGRGENCRVCHVSHAGGAAKVGVVEQMRYGKWNAPMRFVRTASGGSCFPGCHPRYGYDTASPVRNDVAPRATLVTAATVVDRPPARIELTARDQRGALVTVPDASRPTIILLLGENPPLAEQAIQALAATPARVVVVTRAATSSSRWPVVVDAAGDVSRELDVHAWPMAVLVSAEGREVARVGGTGEAVAMKLAGYLDPRVATTRPAVAGGGVDPRRTEAQRDLLEAERLLAAGRTADAERLAVASVPFAPDPARAHYVIGRAREQAGDFAAAARAYRAMREPATRPAPAAAK
jgi:predicted CXXCH cytochrome family protein